MIKWIYKPSGICPVQSEGFFLGTYFYFRARWNKVVIEFAETEKDWKEDKLIVSYVLKETKDRFGAGFFSPNKCKFFIWKGCFKLLFHKTKKLI